MKRKLTFLFILFILVSQVAWVRLPQPPRPVRTCVYENPPKIYTEMDGAISGFWPDLLRDIAAKEGWQIEWVRGTWDECLHKLSRGEIDILPDMGWTPERSETFALSSETVLLSWARLYEAKGVRIESVLDLEGKTIAGLEGSFDLDGPHGIRKLADSFGLHCRFVEMSSYTETFKALQSGLVDVAVVDGDFGRKFADEFGVIATPIIIQPTRMLFAFPKDVPLTQQLIEAVDSAVREAKNDPDSVYYQAMDTHLGRRGIEILENGIPRWTKILLLILTVILVSLAVAVVIFRVQVRRRTRDLRESEERFRLAFHTIPDSIKISRLEDGLYLDINQGFIDMTGFKRDEVIGHTSQEIGIWHNPEDRDRLVEALKKHGRVENMEAKFCTKDGTVLTGLISASVIMLHGEPHILSVTRNIEEIKQAQESLHRSERMLNEAQRIAHIGSWELDLVHDSLYWSDEIFRLLELPEGASSASYEAFMQRVHPEDRDRMTCAYAESVEKQIPFKFEHRLLMPDGRVKWVQEQCETYYDEEGKPQRAIGTMMDITDRKIMELTLREREDTLRTLINATPDVICLKDAQGHWLEANQAYLALFELEDVDYRGKHNRELAALRPFYHDAFQECEKTDELAWQKGDVFHGIESIRRPDGSIRYYDVIKAPIFEENGTRKGLVVIGRDVTALNQALTAEKEAR
ncbi:MAG: PAS domain S-box protein, partial [Chloroflexi bacterium]|nr:PAS domain S-box protein [Chloroflexota bacterium]